MWGERLFWPGLVLLAMLAGVLATSAQNRAKIEVVPSIPHGSAG